MRKVLKKISIGIGGIVGVILLALSGLTLFFSTEKGQKWFYAHGISLLEEKLGTKVVVGHISVNPFTGNVTLYDTEIYDRKAVRMLSVDTLEADIYITGLLKRELSIEGIKLAGADMVIYKEYPDTAANYQFVFDAFKKKDKDKAEDRKHPFTLVMDIDNTEISRTRLKWDILSAPQKGGDTLDTNHLDIADFSVKFSGAMQDKKHYSVELEDLSVMERKSNIRIAFRDLLFDNTKNDSATISLKQMKGSCRDKRIGCKLLAVSLRKDSALRTDRDIKLHVEKLSYYCNNGKPRKNTGKRHRGWFDPGHLDTEINADVTIYNIGKDSVNFTVRKLAGIDKGSGLDIRNLYTQVEIKKGLVTLANTSIALANTKIKLGKVVAQYTKPEHTGMKPDVRIATFPLSAYVSLQDIAKPFAPPLNHFTTPLTLNVNVGGDMNRIVFSNIRINTTDKRLGITANGDLCKLLGKKDLCLHFNDIRMYANNGVKEQIVNHFAKKIRLKMMRQLAAIGNITYSGNLGIYYKREDISGKLTCPYGNVFFAFTLDGTTKYMTGMMRTDSINLGKIMNIKDLRILKTNASYSFSIASNKGRKTHNRLPQGWLKADVSEAFFKRIGFKSIHAEINSDGANATGFVRTYRKILDIYAEFTYRQTDAEQSLRIHPHFKLHKKSPAEKSKIQEERNLRKQLKEQRKAERKATKERAASDTTQKREKKRFSFRNLFRTSKADDTQE